MRKLLAGDYLMAGEIIVIGLAAVSHVAAVFLGWPFARCAMIFAVSVVLFFAGAAGVFFLCRKGMRLSVKESIKRVRRGCGVQGRTERLMLAVFAVIVLTQIIFICAGDTAYRDRDMTVETVGSFLETDSIYQVNPMTGAPYTEGLPSRLKILCLPTLYGSLCKISGLSPVTMIQIVIPVLTLVSCYTAFALLASALFPEREGKSCRKERICFMTVVSLLVWTGAYQYGMDGFGLLCCGWRGVTIRNLVLLPWLLSLCLRKKWLPAVLCILGEACIVWTLYGCGICLPFCLGMAGIQWGTRGFFIKEKRGGQDDRISS